MIKKHDANKLILEEIDSLKEEEGIKELLKEILDFEINNETEKHFTESYEKIIEIALRNSKVNQK